MSVLVYLCGDNHLVRDTTRYLKTLLQGAPRENLHVIVQHDTALGARRYVVRAGNRRIEKPPSVRRDVNTGDAAAFKEFLDWGLSYPADRQVLILSGLGVNPRYVRQSLPLELLPEGLRKVRGGKPGDPYDDGYNRRFNEALRLLGSNEQSVYRELIHDRLFSICHDFSNSGSLEITRLREVLSEAVEHMDVAQDDPRFELVLVDAAGAAFVEVLFELEGLARAFVGSLGEIPDSGFPYAEILDRWNQLAADSASSHAPRNPPRPLGHRLAIDFVECVKNHRDELKLKDPLVAVNLDALDEVARVLDAIALALMQSLGDWHVLHAVTQATAGIPPVELWPSTVDTAALDQIEFLPGVDLFELLDRLDAAFHTKLQGGEVPVAFGQIDRIQKLYKLLRKSVAHLRSDQLLGAEHSESGSLLLASSADSHAPRGLGILLPPTRTKDEVNRETGRRFSLASASYSRLNFSRRVHWSALAGAVQMIYEKPHALWRVISSMLADASSPARDAALGRLVSAKSVISDLRGQFQSLGETESLTLSLGGLENRDDSADLCRLQLRLEPSLSGGVIYEQESRIYRSAMDATMRDLRSLLLTSQPTDQLLERLRSLGASLGEDIIQDLCRALETERASIVTGRDETPHLTLQMPRELMRFPWELMRDERGMLCERYALGRQVFMDARAARQIPRRGSDLIRVLVIGDPEFVPEFQEQMSKRGWQPTRLPSARTEAQTIVASFERLRDEMAGVISFKIQPFIDERITVNEMRQLLRDGGFDLIHYAGHAYFDEGGADGSAWVLSDGLLHAREMRNTLQRVARPPWLIFANACEAGMDQGSSGTIADVSGLPTACINHGVAAYIAPLWPVDDEIARWLAVGFYRELLRERLSIGEALRRARLSIWRQLRDSGAAQTMPAKIAMTWSSFVLYGDPTTRLLQAMWTPAQQSKEPENELRPEVGPAAAPAARRPRRARHLKQPPLGQLREVIDFPAALVVDGAPSVRDARGSAETSGASAGTTINSGLPDAGFTIELAERSGVRFWRSCSPEATAGRSTFSPLGELLNQDQPKEEAGRQSLERIRSLVGHERGVVDLAHAVKKWIFRKITGKTGPSLFEELISEFDRQQVPQEGLFRIASGTKRRRLPPPADMAKGAGADGEWLSRGAVPGQMNRALLIVHGTFSCSWPTIEEFACQPSGPEGEPAETENLLAWMLRRYRAVLAYDHWTLSKAPARNAEELRGLLPKSWKNADGKVSPLEVDIICHSRGGLVTRELIESGKTGFTVGRVVFVGVPHAGTSLANPENWGSLADMLINLVSEDPTGLLGRLSGLLCYLAAQGITREVPGLDAMRPGSDALRRLQRPTPRAAEYFAVASNYVPDRSSLSILSILEAAGDALVDKFFDRPNDLVVDTESMWAIDKPADWSSEVTTIPANHLLLFQPRHDGPGNIAPIREPGVHHINYFKQPAVRNFIRATLDRG